MEVEKIIDKPYLTLKQHTKKGIKRINVSPNVAVLEENKKRNYIKYGISYGSTPVGFVALINKAYGVWVDYIENFDPDKFSGLGKIADQLEVEHCLNRGLKEFSVLSDAIPSSLAFHYKRGKRFDYILNAKENINLKEKYGTFNMNVIIEQMLKKNTFPDKWDIGTVPMYMPKDLIKKYIDIIAKFPLLKR